jgi:hypothetical protein
LSDTSAISRVGHQARRARAGFLRLTQIGFPARFPIVQFPNLPLVIAFLAEGVRHFVTGSGRPYLTAIGWLAITIWAYEELAHGSNWFRRLLGAGFLIITTVRVAHAVG